MNRIAVVLFLGWVVLGLAGEAAKANPLHDKKLIQWGWDEPNTRFIRNNIATMEQMPFDGLVFHIDSSRGGPMHWEMWGPRRFELAEFKHAIEDLKATPFKKFTELFLRVNVTPGNVDWFDDGAFGVVLDNFVLAAQVAQQGGVRGFMFDVEQYQDGLFGYRKQKYRGSKSFAEYRAKVRQRGREWMAAVTRHYPDITILLTFGYRLAQPGWGGHRSKADYGLLADFLDGMMEACPATAKLVDAWEFSYPYKRPKQFRKAYETIKKKSAEWSAVPQHCGRLQAGFGIWMDCKWRKLGWHEDNLSKNYFSPADLENTVRAALESSDKYVWIYSETPRWWPREKLPQAYVDALYKAREPEIKSQN